MSCHSDIVKPCQATMSCSVFSSSPLAATLCSHLWWLPISARSLYHQKRDILLVLLSKFSRSVKWHLYFSLTQEVSQLGRKCWNIFYTSMAMPDGSVVVIKGFCVLWHFWLLEQSICVLLTSSWQSTSLVGVNSLFRATMLTLTLSHTEKSHFLTSLQLKFISLSHANMLRLNLQ